MTLGIADREIGCETSRCPDCKRRFSHGHAVQGEDTVRCTISPDDLGEWNAKDDHNHVFGRYLGVFQREGVEWGRAGCNKCSRIIEFPTHSVDRLASANSACDAEEVAA